MITNPVNNNKYSFESKPVKVLQSIAWVVLAILALPTIIGSCFAMKKAIAIWNKNERPDTEKADRIGAERFQAKNPKEAVMLKLNEWVEAAENTDKKKGRIKVEQKINSFLWKHTYLWFLHAKLDDAPLFSCCKRGDCCEGIRNPYPSRHINGSTALNLGTAFDWLFVRENVQRPFHDVFREISSRHISSLPDIFNHKLFQENLESLNCDNLRLQTIPETIGDLRELKYLSFSGNGLTTVPSSIGRLSKLRQLNLYNNPNLSKLPKQILDLPKACIINLRGCNPALRRLYEFTQLPGYEGPKFLLPEEVQNNAKPNNAKPNNNQSDSKLKTRIEQAIEFIKSTNTVSNKDKTQYVEFRQKVLDRASARDIFAFGNDQISEEELRTRLHSLNKMW